MHSREPKIIRWISDGSLRLIGIHYDSLKAMFSRLTERLIMRYQRENADVIGQEVTWLLARGAFFSKSRDRRITRDPFDVWYMQRVTMRKDGKKMNRDCNEAPDEESFGWYIRSRSKTLHDGLRGEFSVFFFLRTIKSEMIPDKKRYQVIKRFSSHIYWPFLKLFLFCKMPSQKKQGIWYYFLYLMIFFSQ